MVTLDLERARVRARQADEALARGEIRGPLHGLPITVKDALETAGIHVQRESHQLGANAYNLRYLKTKAKKSGHLLEFKEDQVL